jgi:hypothetical protein
MRRKILPVLLASIFLLAPTLSAQTQPEVFNVNVYEGVYPDIINAYGSGNLTGATNHWTNQGLPIEGRRASIIFDPVYYLAHNSDLRTAFGEHGYAAAAEHFATQGLPNEGRRGSLEFDVKYYIANNTGVPTTYLAAADDFINTGLPSFGKRGSADFNVKDYINNYPDVAAGYGPTDYQDAALHWLRRGKGQGRQGFGSVPSPVDCVKDRTTEFVTVPLPAPSPSPTPATVTFQIAHPTLWSGDLSIFYVNPPTGLPAQLQNTGGATPLRGQYSASNGTYTFSSADAEAPLQITYSMNPIPTGYSRIFFTHRAPNSGTGTGTFGDPFDASVMDDKLRFISEQISGQVPPNNENGVGAPYGATDLIVCLDNADSAHPFVTLGNSDFLIGVGHTSGNPDNSNPPRPAGFTVNRNWHIHGTGMNTTYVQLGDIVRSQQQNDPRAFPPNTAFGLVFGTHDDNSSGVEISDLTIDDNYPTLKGSSSTPLNLLAVNLRSSQGGHKIHHLNVLNTAGEIALGPASNEIFEAFPVRITSVNTSPDASGGNFIQWVLMSTFGPGRYTDITVDNVAAEVSYNVANGGENGYGGFNMPLDWFHDNVAFNSPGNGFNVDSLVNRNVLFQFNRIVNPAQHGMVIGGGSTYDNFQIQYNTIELAINNGAGILFQGNVTGASVINNNIVSNVATTGTKGIQFTGSGNYGSQFQYNQISSRLGNDPAPFGNCVFNNWNEASVPLANFPNTQSVPCAAPVSQLPLITSQFDPATTNLEVYYLGLDADVHQFFRTTAGVWHAFDVSYETKTPHAVGPLGNLYDTVTIAPETDFVGGDGHVYTQYFNSSDGWHVLDISAQAGGAAASTAPGQLISLMDSLTNRPEVYYVGTDQRIHQLLANFGVGWQHFVIPPQTSPIADASGGLTGVVDTTLTHSLQLFYVGADLHVEQIAWNNSSGWATFDVGGYVGAPDAQPGVQLTSLVNPIAHTLEIYYLGTDQHIHQLAWNASFGWYTEDVNVLTGAPAASLFSGPTAVVDTLNSFIEIFYAGTDGHIHQLGWNPNGWFTFDLNNVTGATSASAKTGLASLINSSNSSLEIYYGGTDSHVHQLMWKASTSWTTRDVNTAVVP